MRKYMVLIAVVFGLLLAAGCGEKAKEWGPPVKATPEQIALVSDGITKAEAGALKFSKFSSLDDALAAALRRHGPEAKVAILTHAPDMLPVISHFG